MSNFKIVMKLKRRAYCMKGEATSAAPSDRVRSDLHFHILDHVDITCFILSCYLPRKELLLFATSSNTEVEKHSLHLAQSSMYSTVQDSSSDYISTRLFCLSVLSWRLSYEIVHMYSSLYTISSPLLEILEPRKTQLS